jgi:hypothetical protein
MFFKQLRVCYFVAPFPTRGRVCNLLLLLDLVSAVPLWLESRGTQNHILLSQFLRLPQPGGPGPRIYIPQVQVAQIYPRAPGSFSVASYDSLGYGGGILSRLHTRIHCPCSIGRNSNWYSLTVSMTTNFGRTWTRD